MIITYLTADTSLVSVCHVGSLADGRAKWRVCVEGMGGAASWSSAEFPTPPSWSAEQVARNALEWAFGISEADCRCNCGDPECPSKDMTPRLMFGPTDAHAVDMSGPYFDRTEAIVAAQIQAGVLDESEVPELHPPLDEILAELDGKPKQPPKPERPSDPYDRSTWKLG